jgi:5-methylcytosine-specific restriction endonuclease McrA
MVEATLEDAPSLPLTRATKKADQEKMGRLRQKRPRLKLGREEYDALRRRVLERDGWRCQSCGASKDLQIHHLKPRSKLGGDEISNLISLCAGCHGMQHGKAHSVHAP